MTPIATLMRKPVPASPSSSPRSRSRSSSRPARKSRNARPSRNSTVIGVSILTQSRTDGPTMMPQTIATTSAEIRALGARLTSSGAPSAMTATTSRPPKEMWVTSGPPPCAIGGCRVLSRRHQPALQPARPASSTPGARSLPADRSVLLSAAALGAAQQPVELVEQPLLKLVDPTAQRVDVGTPGAHLLGLEPDDDRAARGQRRLR